MLIQHHTRVLMSCVLLLALPTVAQVNTPGVPSTGSFVPPPGVVGETVAPAELARRVEAQHAQLRQRLSDPVERAQYYAARLAVLRATHPDLARVLDIDATSEERLLTLLVDQELQNQLQPNPFVGLGAPRPPAIMAADSAAKTERESFEYDQGLRDIGDIIGRQRLDSYLEYTRTRGARQQVEQFNAVLPAELKLSSTQKDALVPVLAADTAQRQRAQSSLPPGFISLLGGSRFVPPAPGPSDMNQRIQLHNLQLTEQNIQRAQVDDARLLAQVSKLLASAQTEVFAELQAQQLQQLQKRALGLRAALGMAPDEPLPPIAPVAPPPALTSPLELTVRLRIGASEVSKRLISRGGRSVSLAAPEGLFAELQPSLSAPETLKLELKVYETVGSARRLIGEGASFMFLSNGQRPTTKTRAALNGVRSGGQTLLRGRKAYLLEWSVSARRLAAARVRS